MRINFIRIAICMLALFGFAIGVNGLYSQCTNTQLGGQSGCDRSNTTTNVEIAPTLGTTPVTVSPYSPGTYFRIPVLAGGCYSVSTCGAPFDTQINCYQGTATTGPFAYDDDNGPLCTGTAASVTLVPNFTDYARVDVRQYACLAGGSSSITVSVQQNNNLSITSSNSNMCQGQVRTLAALPLPVTGGLPNSGNQGSFSGTGVSGSTFTAPVPGGNSQVYTLTYSFGYCTTTQQITVFHTPSTAAAGPDQSICATTTNLAATAPSFGTGAWTVVSGTGIATTPASPTSAVTGLTPGQNTVFLWTVSNGPCSSTADTVVIHSDGAPTIANAGVDQTVCSDTVNLAGNAAVIGTGTWTRISGSGTIQNPNSPTSQVTGLGIGFNSFVWTITNGVCLATADTVEFTRDEAPTIANAGPDQSICSASNTTLAANVPSVGNGAWAILNGSGSVSAPNSPTSALTGIGIGSTVLTWTISNGVCPSSIDTVVILGVVSPVAPTVSGNQSACIGDNVTLTGSSIVPGAQFTWWDAPTGGNAIGSGPVYTTPPLTGNVSVFLSITDTATLCPSSRTQYNIFANPLPVVALGNDSTFCSSDSICLDGGAGFAAYQWSTGATTQLYCTNVTGDYWVEVTSLNGCQNRDTIHLNALPAPTVNLGQDITLCNGNSGTIGIPSLPGLTYLWSNNATTSTITVTAAGTYTLTASDSLGCSNSDLIVVAAMNSPVASFSVDTSNCPVIQFNDLSTDAVTWSWNFGNGGLSSSQNPTSNYATAGNGNYPVTVIVTNPCGADTLTQVVAIDCITGIAMPAHLAITVFPNPNDGMFKVQLDGLDGTADLQIFNELGQQVYARTIVGCPGRCEEWVDLHDAAAGVYFAKIKVGDAVISKRVLIK